MNKDLFCGQQRANWYGSCSCPSPHKSQPHTSLNHHWGLHLFTMPRTTTKNEYSIEIIKCPCLLFGRRENSYKTQLSKSQFRAFFPLTKQNVKKEILKGTD